MRSYISFFILPVVFSYVKALGATEALFVGGAAVFSTGIAGINNNCNLPEPDANTGQRCTNHIITTGITGAATLVGAVGAIYGTVTNTQTRDENVEEPLYAWKPFDKGVSNLQIYKNVFNEDSAIERVLEDDFDVAPGMILFAVARD